MLIKVARTSFFAAALGAVLALGLDGSAHAWQEPAPAEDAQSSEVEGDAAAPDEADGQEGDGAVDEGAGAEGETAGGEADGTEGEAVSNEAEPDLAAPPAPSRFQPITDLIEAGGAVIVILAGLSVVGLMLIVVKLVQFAVLRVGDHRFVDNIWAELRDGHPDEALDIVSKRKGVVARVMETALHAKSIDGDSEAARQEVERVAKAKLDGLERGLPLLSLIATVSPLLGLLGTVLGMIEAFQQMETAGDSVDPAILSGGIWEALLTTAAGLSVAIPAAAFYTWLQRSVDVAGQHMEDAAVRVFTAKLYASGGAETSTDGED